jgi:hypothetical protein
MPQRRSWLLLPAGAVCLLLAACSSTATSTPTPTHLATPTPSTTPLPRDTMTVSVLASGVGTFDLAAIPVAELKNDAKFHGAASVIVHFVTHRSGGNLGSLESVAVNLAPGETLAVTADCTDACNGATSVSATVEVGSWPTAIGAVFTTASARYSCQPCHSAHGFGEVKGTLTPSSTIAAGQAVVAFAVCRNRAGAILGGGSEEFVWQSGATLSADVPVVVNAAPASCSLGASTGW